MLRFIPATLAALLMLASCGSCPSARHHRVALSPAPVPAVTLRNLMDYLPGLPPGYLSL